MRAGILALWVTETLTAHCSLNSPISAEINPNSINMPDENLENFHLMIGRVFKLSPKNNIRVVIQGGPGVSAIREPVFTTINNNETVFSDYHIGFRKRQQVSLILNPKIEFPVTCVLGFSVGPMLIVNDERTFLARITVIG